MLNNIVDNLEQCGQQNIVQCCFHQARRGCPLFAVYNRPARSRNEQEGYSGSSCKLASCADMLYWPENCLKVGTAEFSYGYFLLCVIMVASMTVGR